MLPPEFRRRYFSPAYQLAEKFGKMYFTVLLLAAILNQVVQSQPSDSSEQSTISDYLEQSQYYGIAEPSNSSEQSQYYYGIAEPSDSSEELPYGIAEPEHKIIYWSSEDAKTVWATPSSDYLIISKDFSTIWGKRRIVHVLYKSLGNNLFTEIDRFVSRFDSRFNRRHHQKDWIFELAQYFGRTRGIPRYPEKVSDMFDFYLIPPNATVVSVPYVHPREFNEPRTSSQKDSIFHSSLSRQAKGLNQIEMLVIQELVQKFLRDRHEDPFQSKEVLDSDLRKNRVHTQMDAYLKSYHNTVGMYKKLVASMRRHIGPLKKLHKKLNDDPLKYKPNEKGIKAMRAIRGIFVLEGKAMESLDSLYIKMQELKLRYPSDFKHTDIPQLAFSRSKRDSDTIETLLILYVTLFSHTRIRDLLKPRVSTIPKYKEEQQLIEKPLRDRKDKQEEDEQEFTFKILNEGDAKSESGIEQRERLTISKAFKYGEFFYFILVSAIAALSV